MAYDIFISYRREGGYETAKHLYDLLNRDGYKVSFDIDTLRNGDFDIELYKRIRLIPGRTGCATNWRMLLKRARTSFR